MVRSTVLTEKDQGDFETEDLRLDDLAKYCLRTMTDSTLDKI